jgi:hypothetical protein
MPDAKDPLSILDSFKDSDFAAGVEALDSYDDEKKNPFLAPIDVLRRNANTLNQWAPVWLKWLSVLTPLIMSDFEVDSRTGVGRAERSASFATPSEPVERPDILAIVAPGASLDDIVRDLKDWKGLILCSLTALSTLYANGVRPHFTIAIDGHDYLGTVAQAAPWEKWGTKLLIPNTIATDVATAFPSSRYWFKNFIQGKNGGNNPFNRFMELIHPWIRSWTFQAGCVTNVAFLVSTILNIAGLNNIKKVFLFGADFGYLNGKSRALSYYYDPPSDRWIPRPRPSIESQTTNSVLATSANGILTDIGMLGYKRSLYTVWQMQGRQRFIIPPGYPGSGEERETPCLYSCSPGILFELPRCDPLETIKSSGDNASTYESDLIDEVFFRYVTLTGKMEGQIKHDA